MRDDERNVESKVEPAVSHETLKFRFTPVDVPRGDETNPHAKATTHIPEVVAAIRERFGAAVLDVEEYAGEHTVYVIKEQIVAVCRFLKEEQGFIYFSDLGGIDRFTEEERYEVFYNLLSFDPPRRIRLKVRVDEEDLTLPTITPVYRAANWNEREAYDMLGLRFEGHSDLRRMYMPEDFEYHPLRKEFPQLGIPGSLPLPPQSPEDDLTRDPYPAAHGSPTLKSYEEPTSAGAEE